MTWLVTGGAGYIGAHVVRSMAANGTDVVVVDDLSTGDASRIPGVPLVVGTVGDRDLVRGVMRAHSVHGVVHIAGKKQVGESVDDPLLYYRENVDGMVALLDCCQEYGVAKFVFSSSASVYGVPDVELVTEQTPCQPVNPYGETKLVGEWMIRDCTTAWGLDAICLRYFNVAGAASPELGDPGAFNLIPLVFEALSRGQRPKVFGDDYPTPDGTGVRDYVHVADVADAHLAATSALEGGAHSVTYNIGRGEGFSVLEVLRAIGEVTGLDVTPEVVGRRAGDPARVVAAVDRIRDGLGFTTTHELYSMVDSAWSGWQLRH
jgi:UDP-glucose 4-epimerase